jgi:hypothetical protein
MKLHVKSLLLSVVILLSLISPASVFAEDIVKSIEFENSSPLNLFVEQDTNQLKVFATIEGSTTKKDVTNSAYWVSSNSAAVKVDKGLITPLTKGSSRITAKYYGLTIGVDVTANYLFKELQLSENQPLQLELGTVAPQLKAFAVENDSSSNEVTSQAGWTSSDLSVATVSEGKITLAGKGTTTIISKYKGLSDSVVLTVTSPFTKVTIDSPSPTEILVGQEDLQLQATATNSSGSTELVTAKADWSTTSPGTVTVDKGMLKGINVGTAKIKVSYLGVSTEIPVIVRLPYQAITVTPSSSLNLFVTDSPVAVQAAVFNDLTSKLDITQLGTWSWTNQVVATVTAGLISPKSVGSSTISVSYRGLNKNINVTVLPVITSIQTNAATMNLFKGEVIQLPQVTGTTIADQTQDLSSMASWTSSNVSVANIENGKLLAKKAGTTQLTVTVKNFSYSVEVTVQEKVLRLKPSQTAYQLVESKEAALPTVKALYEDGVEEDISSKITWKVSSPNLLIKDSNMRGLLNSRVSLTGTYLNKSVTIPVVIESEITNITLDSEDFALNMKQSRSIKVTGTDSDGKTLNLSSKMNWVSSDPKVAVVRGANVSGVAEGSATLTGSYQGVSKQVTIRVVPRLLKLQSEESSYKLKVNETKSLAVDAVYDTGKADNITDSAVWTSSNLSIVSVSNGKIKALKKGTVTIKAVFNNKTVSIRITVQ